MSTDDAKNIAASIFSSLVSRIADQTASLGSLNATFPSGPLHPLAAFLDHLTFTPPSWSYFPYLPLGIQTIHAVRMTTIWAALTKGKDRSRVGTLQDLFGYLTLAWGSATVVSLLLSRPPSWLISPGPWFSYPFIYALLIPTGLSNYIISTCPPLIFNIFGSCVDGLIRGMAISSVPAMLSAADVKPSWFTHVVVSGIAVSASGWLVTGLGLHETEWRLAVPSVLNGGVLDTMDLWGGMVVGAVHAALMRSYSEFRPLSDAMYQVLPSDVRINTIGDTSPIVSPAIGRAICVLLLGSLLCGRILIKSFGSFRRPSPVKAKTVQKASAIEASQQRVKEKEASGTVTPKNEQIVKVPLKVDRRESTPRKSPRPKKI